MTTGNYERLNPAPHQLEEGGFVMAKTAAKRCFFFQFLGEIAESDTKVPSKFIPKESFCSQPVGSLTFVNGSNKTFKKRLNWPSVPIQ